MIKIEDAIEEIKKGNFILIVDDPRRENEVDLVIAAEKITPEKISFMLEHTSGIICVPMTSKRLKELNLQQMVEKNTSNFGTPFTVSVDAKKNVSTGVSAKDRYETIMALVDEKTKPEDLGRPGHVFPLKASEAGLLKRAGHTEAALDIVKLSGLYPVAVLCEVMKKDGTMARIQDLEEFKEKYNIKIVTINDMINYRKKQEKLIKKEAVSKLPTKYGEFKLMAYSDIVDGSSHIALIKGDVNEKENVLVRLHSQCLTGDTFFSKRCDCGRQFEKAMSIISKIGTGVILYLSQEGRGIGLANKIKAYALQDQGMDTVEANKMLGHKDDMRDYGSAAQILKDLGVKTIRLMTNNPRKIDGLVKYGIRIEERIPIKTEPNKHNKEYIETKKEKLGHLL